MELNPFAAPFVPRFLEQPTSFSSVVAEPLVKKDAKEEIVCAEREVESLGESVNQVTLVDSPAEVEETPEADGQGEKSRQEETKTPVVEESPIVKSSEHFAGYCTTTKMTPDDFEILAVVGQGAFGKVRVKSSHGTRSLETH